MTKSLTLSTSTYTTPNILWIIKILSLTLLHKKISMQFCLFAMQLFFAIYFAFSRTCCVSFTNLRLTFLLDAMYLLLFVHLFVVSYWSHHLILSMSLLLNIQLFLCLILKLLLKVFFCIHFIIYNPLLLLFIYLLLL